MKIHYEPHPVTPERKAELRQQGFKIVDVRFDPNGGKGVQSEEITPESISVMKKAGVVELLEAHGVEEAVGNVAELRDQLIKIMFMEA